VLLFRSCVHWASEREANGLSVHMVGMLMVHSALLGLLVLGVAEGGVRRPKRIEGSDSHQLPWLSTPKYPCGPDNGRADDGYYQPIKKEHSMRNYEIPIKCKRK